MTRELLIGCGSNNKKKITLEGMSEEWGGLTTLDCDECHKPDIVHDLDVFPYPFEDNTFDEIHAYEVLEHCGQQGDFKFFFDQFTEFWRILKPGGLFLATVPAWDSPWAWGDPGHTRVITEGSILFLDQSQYEKQVGITAMSDYRTWYSADFEPYAAQTTVDSFGFVLKARK